jgi:hypothetical protein
MFVIIKLNPLNYLRTNIHGEVDIFFSLGSKLERYKAGKTQFPIDHFHVGLVVPCWASIHTCVPV